VPLYILLVEVEARGLNQENQKKGDEKMETVKLTKVEHAQFIKMRREIREKLEFFNSKVAQHSSVCGIVRCGWVVSDDAGFSIEIKNDALCVTGSTSPVCWEEDTADYILEIMRETAIGPKLKKVFYKDWYVMMRDNCIESLECLDSNVIVITDLD